MAIQTDIEYADSTCNGMMGCDGCELWNKKTKICYAGRMTGNYAGRKGWPKAFNRPEVFDGRIQEAARWPDLTGTKRALKPWLDGYPRIIFLNDMGDPFTNSLPIDWLLPYIPVIENSKHIWLVLSKYGSRMVQFFNDILGYVPANIWPGMTITGQNTIQRLDYLLQLKTAINWISVEPYLTPIMFPEETFDLVDWIVIGGASGADAPILPPNRVRALRDKCNGRRSSFFFKQWGEHIPYERIGDAWLAPNGRPVNANDFDVEVSGIRYKSVGKAQAGRWLDGILHSNLPKHKPTGQMALL